MAGCYDRCICLTQGLHGDHVLATDTKLQPIGCTIVSTCVTLGWVHVCVCGGGLHGDHVLATDTKLQPIGCTIVSTCVTLGWVHVCVCVGGGGGGGGGTLVTFCG